MGRRKLASFLQKKEFVMLIGLVWETRQDNMICGILSCILETPQVDSGIITKTDFSDDMEKWSNK